MHCVLIGAADARTFCRARTRLASRLGGWGPRAAAWNGVLAPPPCPALHERPAHDCAISPLRRFGSHPHRRSLALTSCDPTSVPQSANTPRALCARPTIVARLSLCMVDATIASTLAAAIETIREAVRDRPAGAKVGERRFAMRGRPGDRRASCARTSRSRHGRARVACARRAPSSSRARGRPTRPRGGETRYRARLP